MPMLTTDEEIRKVLEECRTIAVVGLSDNPRRDSYDVAKYLQQKGYTVIPVNPNVASVLGRKAFPSLEEIGEPVDLVDVFRRPEHLPAIVTSSLAIGAKVLWTQLGVVHTGAAATASAGGLSVVMDRCIMVEHTRLLR